MLIKGSSDVSESFKLGEEEKIQKSLLHSHWLPRNDFTLQHVNPPVLTSQVSFAFVMSCYWLRGVFDERGAMCFRLIET